MAHFAKISEENEVLQVMVVNDPDTTNEEGEEVESIGQNFLQTHFSWPAHLWIKCSYNTFEGKHRNPDTLEPSADQSKAFRGNYPQIGYTWDSENEIFLAPKIYDSYVKNVSEARWQSPIGDAPELTAEQQSQNDAQTHAWYYQWREVPQEWELLDLNTQ
jgi:hypothetical protein|tara:strand:+ start:48 stop:527 length:480 start_codon:yes stop_codon:yes gene_type:complete